MSTESELEARVASLQDDLAELTRELDETNRGVAALYTELDNRTAQLRDANDAKSRFLANVSHELRSPLNSVLALAGLLREPDSEPLTLEQDEQVRLIQSSAAQLLGLVNDLLDLAKAEADALQPVPVELDVAAVIAELRATLHPVTPAGVDVRWLVPDGLPTVHTDPVLLSQVLRNLISNALKYTERGTVTVTVGLQQSTLTIAVADTGLGIAPEHEDLVFEPFSRVPNPLQSKVKGTGLGLSYSRQAMTALGGSLGLTSAIGVGSTFTVTLPLDSVRGAAGSTALGTVLIADDDAGFRTVLRRMLTGVARRIVEAATAPAAIEMLHNGQPDLVLIDLHMPGGGGAEVLREIAAAESLRPIPVVVITSATAADSAPIVIGRPVVAKSELTAAVLLDAIGASTNRPA